MLQQQQLPTKAAAATEQQRRGGGYLQGIWSWAKNVEMPLAPCK